MSDPAQTPPQDPKALLSEALLAHLERRDPEAETLYQSALASDPKLVSGLVWYALLLVEHGRTAEATAQLDSAIRTNKVETEERLKTALQHDPEDDAVRSLWNLYETRLKACPHCGVALTPEIKICPSCGQPVRLCSACGKPISFQMNFCPLCGTLQQK